MHGCCMSGTLRHANPCLSNLKKLSASEPYTIKFQILVHGCQQLAGRTQVVITISYVV